MKLYPAIQTPDGIVTGKEDDSHKSLIKTKKLTDIDDSQKGFTPNGKIFLTRLSAVEFLKKYDPMTHKKVQEEAIDGLHTHMYAKANGVQLKSIDISRKNILVIDRGGLYTYVAEKLGEKAKKVWYYIKDANPYPESPMAQIGTGLDTIERVYSPYEYINNADTIVFPDCYDGLWQIDLRAKGHNVFGSHGSEKFELDKEFFFQFLVDHDFPLAETFKVTGLNNLIEYLKDKEDKWLKQNYFRGDFETFHHVNANQSRPWFDHLKAKLGARADTVKILVQDPIPEAIEVGYDGFCLNDQFTSNGLIGYEIKDKGFISKVFPKTPKILSDINNVFAPYFKEMGNYSHFSTEVRIADDGKAYPIDWTQRCPSPPGELMTEIYTNYAEVVDEIACGELSEPEIKDEYGAEIILYSPWNETNELCVEFPKDIEKHIKLKSHAKHKDHYTVIPNGNGGYFGAVVATGKSVREATEKCKDIIKEVKAYQMEFDESIFDEAQEASDKGRKFGLGY